MSLLYFIDMIIYYKDYLVIEYGVREPSERRLMLLLGFLVPIFSFLHLFQQQKRLLDPTNVTIAGIVSALAILVAANVSFSPDPLSSFDVTLIYGYGTAYCVQWAFILPFTIGQIISTFTFFGYFLLIASVAFLVLAEIAVGRVANRIYNNFWTEYADNRAANQADLNSDLLLIIL